MSDKKVFIKGRSSISYIEAGAGGKKIRIPKNTDEPNVVEITADDLEVLNSKKSFQSMLKRNTVSILDAKPAKFADTGLALAEANQTIKEHASIINQKDSVIADKDALIAKLQKQLEDAGEKPVKKAAADASGPTTT